MGLIAVVFATAIGSIYASENMTTSLFVAPATSVVEQTGFMGHVEYVLKDSEGNIIYYYQTDNFVTDMGKDCTASQLFDNSVAVGDCLGSVGQFQFIGVADIAPGQDNPTVVALANEIGARHQDTSVGLGAFTQASDPTGTIVSIDTTAPFTFGAGNNSNNIFQAGLFDSLTAGNAFAIQNTTSALDNPGIDVNDGDTLSVTWTITVG